LVAVFGRRFLFPIVVGVGKLEHRFLTDGLSSYVGRLLLDLLVRIVVVVVRLFW
jgi:hypothetical protein